MKINEYLQYDAMGLAQLIQQKQITAPELLEVAIARYQQVNPKLNAVVIPMLDLARQRARQQLTGPFAGVPFLLKDLQQDYRGVASSYGCKGVHRKMQVAQQHANIVQRWEDAGLISFAMTNSPELGIKGITEPELWGACHNPWSLQFNSGGSSGGSAAAVAGGIVPAAGASDGGGSIRIPASYCGLFGLKPSRGRTPWGPEHGEAMHGAAMHHVLTKTVRDSAALLDCSQGADLNAPFQIQAPSQSYLQCLQQTPHALKIAVQFHSPIGTKVSPDAHKALQKTVKLLQSLGHNVIEDQPAIDGMAMAKDFVSIWFNQFAYQIRELKQKFHLVDDDFEFDSLAIAAFAKQAKAIDYIDTLNRWGDYSFYMNQFFQNYDLLLSPATASVAPRNGQVKTSSWQKLLIKGMMKTYQAHHLAQGKVVEHLIRNNLEWVPFTQLANITGLPAMSVPLYWNSDQLPIGSQFIAPFGREDRLLQLAAQLEQAQPWQSQYRYIALATHS
ncbi:amidase [Acinetobacter larvae]|uniref:Amidase n=1 Tax=Acinetobacter larvae TaxID=1789224 RepID=A0A1B2M0S9_9GAMM|nr:amidase family protein [Acinetobacter larvae]AOA58623.1 amidase [Acinetobacter larvae]